MTFEDFIDDTKPGLPTHHELNLSIMGLAGQLDSLKLDLTKISAVSATRDAVLVAIHHAIEDQSRKLDALLAWKASMRAIAGQ